MLFLILNQISVLLNSCAYLLHQQPSETARQHGEDREGEEEPAGQAYVGDVVWALIGRHLRLSGNIYIKLVLHNSTI